MSRQKHLRLYSRFAGFVTCLCDFFWKKQYDFLVERFKSLLEPGRDLAPARPLFSVIAVKTGTCFLWNVS